LFPRGGGAAPDAGGFRAPGLEPFGEQWKVVLFAKEGGQVGGEAVDELLPLHVRAVGRAALEPLQIAFEGHMARFTQTPGQAAVDHRLLALMQADAGTLVDEGADAGEIPRVERELAIGDDLEGFGHGWVWREGKARAGTCRQHLVL